MLSKCLSLWLEHSSLLQHFLMENPLLVFSSQDSHKRAKKEKREPLDEDQLFVVELARDIGRVCQVKTSCEPELMLAFPHCLSVRFEDEWDSVIVTVFS